jgi:hypothetical protein
MGCKHRRASKKSFIVSVEGEKGDRRKGERETVARNIKYSPVQVSTLEPEM